MMASLGVSIVNAINGGEISTIVASSTMAVGMLMGSLMWPSLLRRYQKKCILAEEKHRKDRYTSYIAGIENNLLDKRERTVRLLNDSFCPSPEILSSMLDRSCLLKQELASKEIFFLVACHRGNIACGVAERGFRRKI